MTLYKLTDQDGFTYGGCQWGEGVEHEAPGTGPLCSASWLHAYTNPILAVLLNPIHANFASPRLWEAEGNVGLEDHGLKVGCTRLRTVRELPLPVITIEQRVRFALLCVREVCTDAEWLMWSYRWLSGEDRTAESAQAAWAAGRTRAAWKAARAARAAWVAKSEELVAAAESAWAVEAAAEAEAATLDLIGLARRAVAEEGGTSDRA